MLLEGWIALALLMFVAFGCCAVLTLHYLSERNEWRYFANLQSEDMRGVYRAFLNADRVAADFTFPVPPRIVWNNSERAKEWDRYAS